MEARSEALEAHGGDLPVSVAARAAQEIDLLLEALDEARAQLGEQRGIVTRGRRQRRIEEPASYAIAQHLVEHRLRRGLQPRAL